MASHPPSTTRPLSMGRSSKNAPRCSSSLRPTKYELTPPAALPPPLDAAVTLRSSPSRAPPGITRWCFALPTLVPIVTLIESFIATGA